jgi:hypothetical protein
MGVLYDYFHAVDGGTAVEWAIGPGGDWQHGRPLDEIGADWIDAKGLDPDLVLGQLVAHADGVLFRDLGDGPDLRWPDQRQWPYSRKALEGEASPWDTGILLQEIPDRWRDTLAGIAHEAVPAIAARWVGSEEANFSDQLHAEDCARVFMALARRAREAGNHVYCRCSL